jgi:hypothetical protein
MRESAFSALRPSYLPIMCHALKHVWAAAVQDFYEDVFEELDKFGEVENLNVCDNIADHMVGSVYVKFVDENAAAKAMQVRLSITPAP